MTIDVKIWKSWFVKVGDNNTDSMHRMCGRQQHRFNASYDPMSPNQNKSYPVSPKKSKKADGKSFSTTNGVSENRPLRLKFVFFFPRGFSQKNTLKRHLKTALRKEIGLNQADEVEVEGGWMYFLLRFVRSVSGSFCECSIGCLCVTV